MLTLGLLVLLPLCCAAAVLFQELLNLMPDLSSLLLVLQPSALAALAADTAAVAQKLVSTTVAQPVADGGLHA